jgi:hypothetical protein
MPLRLFTNSTFIERDVMQAPSSWSLTENGFGFSRWQLGIKRATALGDHLPAPPDPSALMEPEQSILEDESVISWLKSVEDIDPYIQIKLIHMVGLHSERMVRVEQFQAVLVSATV